MKKYLSSYWIRAAFYTFLQRFSLTFFGFLNLVLLLRYLTKAQMGTWAIFLAITTIFEQTKSNLLKNAHIKYVTAHSDPKEHISIASSALLINASISLVFILFILLFGQWLSHWFKMGIELADMLVWFIPGLIFMVVFSHLEATQQSFLDFKGGFAGYFVRQTSFFAIIAIYMFGKIPISLKLLALYQSLSFGIGTIVIFLLTRKYLHFQFKPTKAWIKRLFGFGGYIFGSGLLANLCANLDQFFTAKFIDSSSVAYYSVASRINGLVDIPSYAASEIIFPKASRASSEEGIGRVKYLFERMVGILTAFNIPTVLFIMIFPKFVTTVVGGSQYADTVLILQLYMITGIFRPFQNQAANLINSMGKPRLGFIVNTIALFAFLGINYVCIRQIGFYGAAVGTLITNILGVIAWYFIMRKQIDLNMLNIFSFAIDTWRIGFRQLGKLLSRNKQQVQP